MANNWKVVVAGVALLAASCSSSGAEDLATEETTTTSNASSLVESEVAGETLEEDRPAALGSPCGNAELPILEQLEVIAPSGLRARQSPLDGDIIDVLPPGTIVETFGEAHACGVLEDGVWFEIGTPLLATGGWVHSDFLGPVGESPTAPDDNAIAPTITDDNRPEVFGEPCGNAELPVAEQMVVIANDGLRARVFPVDGDVIDVMAPGTIVDTFAEAVSCGVLDDGVWLEIGTPLLATGAWVHSDFLEPVEP